MRKLVESLFAMLSANVLSNDIEEDYTNTDVNESVEVFDDALLAID